MLDNPLSFFPCDIILLCAPIKCMRSSLYTLVFLQDKPSDGDILSSSSPLEIMLFLKQ